MKKITIILTFGFFVLVIAFLGVELSRQATKTAFIQVQKVYEEFNGKIELDKKLRKSEEVSRLDLDSLRVQIKALDRKLKSHQNGETELVVQLKQLTAKYNNLGEKSSAEQERRRENYKEQIWQQINSYVQEYGKEHGYTYIYGATGHGSLMFADKSKNISDKIIKYINEKYEGR